MKWLALVAFACALAACGKNYGTPQAAATASPTPVPTATSATLTVRYNGQLLYGQQVGLYTDSNGAPTGNAIQTQTTGAQGAANAGQVTFTGLTPATAYCFQYSYNVPPPPQGATATATVCTNAWNVPFTLGQ